MKKFFSLSFVLVMIMFSCLFLTACDKGEDYTPELTKTFSANGFKVETTSDFTLLQTSEGIKLSSSGDNEVSFSNTTIYGQYEIGNSSYSFENTSLDSYINDVAKVEGLTLGECVKTITITERLSEVFTGDLSMKMYITDSMTNPDGNWDYYSILCIGKGSNAFVRYVVNTSIQDEFYEDNIEKISLVLSSTEFQTPSTDKAYNDSVKSYISSTIVNSGEFMSYYKFKFFVPNDYVVYENPGSLAYNYLNKSDYPDEDWSSSIRCSNLASFIGNAILDDDGAKHLIKFSKENYLGFYTKSLTGEGEYEYNVYYIDSSNKLNIYYIMISVSCSSQLSELGFIDYFEEQMISWMGNVEILD